MEICIDYIISLRDKVFKCSYEDISSCLEKECDDSISKLVLDVRNNIRNFKIDSDANSFMATSLVEIDEQRDRLKLIDRLGKLNNKLEKMSEKTINNTEKNELLKTLIKVEREEDKRMIRGYSARSISRHLVNKTMNEKQIRVICKYFIYYKLQDASIFNNYCIATRDFVEELIGKYGTRDQKMYILDQLTSKMQEVKTREKLVDDIFTNLIVLDQNIKNKSSKNEKKSIQNKLNQLLSEVVDRAIENSGIDQNELNEIKNEAFVPIQDNFYFYRKILGEEETLKDSGFLSIVLYHFSNKALQCWEKKGNGAWLLIANKIYYKAAILTGNMLNPSSTIVAPCFLMGRRIYVGKYSKIDKKCCIGEHVLILGSIENVRNVDNEEAMTTVGEGTIIKEHSVVLPGVDIMANCIIERYCVVDRTLDTRSHLIGIERCIDMKQDYYETAYHEYIGQGKEAMQ